MENSEVERIRKVEYGKFKQRFSISVKVLALVVLSLILFSGVTVSLLNKISKDMGEAVIPFSFLIAFACFAVLLLWSLFSTNSWEKIFARQYVPARLKKEWKGVSLVSEEFEQPHSARLFENKMILPAHFRSSANSLYLVDFNGTRVRLQSLVLFKRSSLSSRTQQGSSNSSYIPVFEGLAIEVSFSQRVFEGSFAFRPLESPWGKPDENSSAMSSVPLEVPALSEQYTAWSNNPAGFSKFFDQPRQESFEALARTMFESSKAGQFLKQVAPGNIANSFMPGGMSMSIVAPHKPTFPAIGNTDDRTLIILMPISLTCFQATDCATPIENTQWASGLPKSLKLLGDGLIGMVNLMKSSTGS